jgi:ComF family protein
VKLLQPLRRLVDFCYPRLCAACDAPGDADREICERCFDELRQLEASPACDRCAMPVAQPGAPCPFCHGEGLRPLEGILRLTVFEEPVRRLVHQIKYHGRWTLAEFLADRLLGLDPVLALLGQTDVLVPVPLHPLRRISRGYNQAELISKRLASRCAAKVLQPVVRLKNTETQTHLHSKLRRYDNMRDAFGLLHPKKVHKKHVVIVDDVLTTGATLISVARTLSEAEPASICAIVVAVADPKGRDFQAV